MFIQKNTTQAYFKTFTGKEIPDTCKTAQVILALAVDSREEAKDVVGKAICRRSK